MSVPDLLDRLEAWLRDHRPHAWKRLREPASDQSLIEAQGEMGVLPPEMTAIWAWHDGQTGPPWLYLGPGAGHRRSNESATETLGPDGVPRSWEGWRLLSVEESRRTWTQIQKAVPRGLRERNWWRPEWAPLLTNDRGGFLCVDRAGSFQGLENQLLLVDFHTPQRSIRSADIETWLSKFVESLEEGLWTVDETQARNGHDGFRPKEPLMLRAFWSKREEADFPRLHGVSMSGGLLLLFVIGTGLIVAGVLPLLTSGFSYPALAGLLLGLAFYGVGFGYGYGVTARVRKAVERAGVSMERELPDEAWPSPVGAGRIYATEEGWSMQQKSPNPGGEQAWPNPVDGAIRSDDGSWTAESPDANESAPVTLRHLRLLASDAELEENLPIENLKAYVELVEKEVATQLAASSGAGSLTIRFTLTPALEKEPQLTPEGEISETALEALKEELTRKPGPATRKASIPFELHFEVHPPAHS